MSTSREQFEEWVRTFNSMPAALFKDEDGEYLDNWIQARWLGWKASRAAVVVDLQPHPKDSGLMGYDYHQGYKSAKETAITAIQMVGLKVKK